jgi:hypothetical protein
LTKRFKDTGEVTEEQFARLANGQRPKPFESSPSSFTSGRRSARNGQRKASQGDEYTQIEEVHFKKTGTNVLLNGKELIHAITNAIRDDRDA